MDFKWILYLTINTKDNKIYVGIHKTDRPDDFDYYIGNGVITTHPSTYKRSKTPFQFAVNKYGTSAFKRFTLMVFDSEEEALKMEERIVNEWFVKRRDTYNVALGGQKAPDGSIEIFQYDFNGNFIKAWKSSVDAANYFNIASGNIRSAIKDKSTSCGYLWTDVFHDKLDIKEFNINIKHEKLYKFDETGKLVAQYKSVKEAAEKEKTTVRLLFNAISSKGKSKGFYYSYNKDFIIDKTIYNKVEKVYLYNLDGSFYMKFNSPRDCADFFNDKKTSRIYSAIRTGGLYKNYQIFKEKQDFAKCIKKPNEKKRVGQYSLDGKLVKVWDTIQSAFLEYGPGVKKCVKGMQNKTKGFIFKLID